jgi:hypothetical protein
MKMDRMVKLLLTLIVLLLSVIALRPLFPSATLAHATDTTSSVDNVSTTSSDQANVVGLRTVLASRIPVSTSDKIRALHVVDSAHSFIVQYDNRIEVYWLDNLIPSAAALTALRNKAAASTSKLSE